MDHKGLLRLLATSDLNFLTSVKVNLELRMPNFYLLTISTVNNKSFTVRKLSRFSQIFIKPRKFSLLNFCSSESSDMYEGGDGKNRKTFPRIPDEPSKPRNFSPSKLLSFTVYYINTKFWESNESWQFKEYNDTGIMSVSCSMTKIYTFQFYTCPCILTQCAYLRHACLH